MSKFPRILFISDAFCAGLLVVFLFSLPSRLFEAPTSYVVVAKDGQLMSASIAADGQWRFPKADSVPDKFIECITTFEDKRFFSHPGLDPLAFGRAIIQNVRSGSVISGGSTLTMQVIRLSRRKQRTFWQKLIEIMMAIRLEMTYSKNDILRLYSANAPFGTNVVGLEAAAWRYYGRSPETLSWGEMATLAVLPNSPSLVHPGRNSRILLKKRNALLNKLFRSRLLDQQSADLAKLEAIPGKPVRLPQFTPHLLNRFRSEYKSSNPEGQRSYPTTTRLNSTVDYQLQLRVNDILKRYQNRYRSNGINNIAALILNVREGNVLAYAGNIYQPEEKELESHVDMIKAPRSPGSTLKPLLYASMLNDGFLLPTTLIPDIPTQIAGYAPQNYDLGYDGAVSADDALSRSLNIPAVRMLHSYRYQRFYNKLKRLGMTTLNQPADHYGLSLILGGSEVTMWDLASIYMGMARSLDHYNDYGGRYNPHDYDAPTYIQEKKDHRFDLYETQISSFLDHGSIWNTFNAMEELMRPGEEGLWEQFTSSQRIAWKTGTSFGFRDAWAIGLTPDHVVCVWVGNADGEGRPGLTGINAAAPVLFDIFRQLPTGEWFTKPANMLRKMVVCRQSGYKAGPNCEDKITEWVSPAGEKTALCPYHRLVHLDFSGQYRISADCAPLSDMLHLPWFVLPPAMEYYYRIRHTDYKELPPYDPSCAEAGNAEVMELIYPKNGAKVYIPLELDGNRGKVIFKAVHRDPKSKIYWHLDGDYLTTTTSFHEVALSPPPGNHRITIVDEQGNRLVQRFTILDQAR